MRVVTKYESDVNLVNLIFKEISIKRRSQQVSLLDTLLIGWSFVSSHLFVHIFTFFSPVDFLVKFLSGNSIHLLDIYYSVSSHVFVHVVTLFSPVDSLESRIPDVSSSFGIIKQFDRITKKHLVRKFLNCLVCNSDTHDLAEDLLLFSFPTRPNRSCLKTVVLSTLTCQKKIGDFVTLLNRVFCSNFLLNFEPIICSQCS